MEKPRRTQPTKARPKPQSGQNLIGNSKLKINEDDASALIGSILEKGISDDPIIRPSRPISAPAPSVLPFPVARHRSHGPHWGPTGKGRGDDHDGDGDHNEDDEDKELEASGRLAAFAGRVQRKEKKVVDLRSWREFEKGENPPKGTARKEVKDREDTELVDAMRVSGKKSSTPVVAQMNGSSMSRDSGLDAASVSTITSRNFDKRNHQDSEPMCIDYQTGEVEMEVDNKQQEPLMLPGRSVSSSNSSEDGQNHLSLEHQIDVENRARLKDMSPDEIADAQAEIMEKMNPSLLNLLKKRGVEKLKKPNVSGSGSASNGVLNTAAAETRPIQNPEVPNTTDRQSAHRTGGMEKREQACPNLWSAWSERVDAVRKLRFSLDGDVLESDVDSVPGYTSGLSGESIDNVSQRDFLRTEGDPGGAGYTIKEAVALSRSVVPGQRSLALHLLASVLEKAICSIAHKQVGFPTKNPLSNCSVDWEAVWAFALGPEPELVLALRMSLDDNHSSVVSGCAKVIQCILSCDLNELFFDNMEKIDMNGKDVFTAPVFRSKPEINTGFLHGGFWKYSAKSSNVFPFEGNIGEESEGKHTIQDDIAIAGQDFAAGLVRMGILPRICYLLESDPVGVLEESLVSILIAIARHSPKGANAVMVCPRLVQTIVSRFTVSCSVDIHPSKILSVRLLKVLAQSERRFCKEFVNSGTFQAMTRHLYTPPCSSLEQWMTMGKEKSKLSAALMVEQLRFWKICIRYGYCTSYFSSIFPAMCLWLNPPTLQKLVERNAIREFCTVSKEAYLVLTTLATKLPHFPHQGHQKNVDFVGDDDSETWMWSYVSPMIDLGVKWIASKSDAFVSGLFEQGSGTTSLLWVYSAILQMFFTVLDKIDPRKSDSGGLLPWLPEFVPKIGLEILKNKFLGSFFEQLCQWRLKSDNDTALASVCCLQGLIRVGDTIDHLIHLAKASVPNPPSEGYDLSREGTVLEKGILIESTAEIKSTVDIFAGLVASEWQLVQSIETFGRGGPAPGVGVGWGISGGGFWSTSLLLAHKDASFFMFLLEILPVEPNTALADRIGAALGASLTVGPRDSLVVEKALDFLLCASTLRYLSICIQNYLALGLRYEEHYLVSVSNLLSCHFRKRWLSLKKRKSSVEKQNPGGSSALETIHEDAEEVENQVDSLTMEWAHQRLPLPNQWFLSPISTAFVDKSVTKNKNFVPEPDNLTEVAKAGLFFVLGLESMSDFSVVKSVPLVWKLHSLSTILLLGMDVLQDEKSRVLYEALQCLFGTVLDRDSSALLRFESDIHESYPTFIETLVEQFGAESYGDVVYGRQVAVYLHRRVEASVRLATWNALSNARVLELLPPLEKGLGAAEGYLEPVEDNEGILEAYVKSWVSGALDRAASRRSLAFTLVVHHVSGFIFGDLSEVKTLLRNKLAKSLLRDSARKSQHGGFMLGLIRYKKLSPSSMLEGTDSVADAEKRFAVLTEMCEGSSTLLAEVQKLRSAFVNRSA